VIVDQACGVLADAAEYLRIHLRGQARGAQGLGGGRPIIRVQHVASRRHRHGLSWAACRGPRGMAVLD